MVVTQQQAGHEVHGDGEGEPWFGGRNALSCIIHLHFAMFQEAM